MTDEEKAREWVIANTGFNPKEPLGKIAVRTFLSGVKAGRPQWHRMDYKDKESFKNIPRYIELLTMYDCGLFVAHCVNKWTGDHWCDHKYGVIAWCEIPTFNDKR